jgi:hypothetical protein
MDFRDKKSKSKKSKFEEEEAKHKRIEKRKKSTSAGRRGSTELTTSLLSADDRAEPRSFFGDSKQSNSDSYNNRNSDAGSVVCSSVNNDKDNKSSAPTAREDYAWDFVVVLPVGLPETEEGEDVTLPALEPSEVSIE